MSDHLSGITDTVNASGRVCHHDGNLEASANSPMSAARASSPAKRSTDVAPQGITGMGPQNPPCQVDVLVVGASFAGIWAAHRLSQEGLDVRLVDASSKVGGSWASTHYPGCRVDAEVPLYEFSEPRLWTSWQWSERFPARGEIQAYLEFACRKLGLATKTILNTRVTGACWEEDTNIWKIFSGNQLLATATFLVVGTGYATIKYVPSIPGQRSFKHAYHSSEWPEGFAYQGKRVAVIGTGASGVQCIETMAPDVEQLVVFQRTPNLALPMQQEQLTSKRRGEMKQGYPACFARRAAGMPLDAIPETFEGDNDDDGERQRVVENLFRKGGPDFWLVNRLRLFSSRDDNDEAYRHWQERTHPRIQDPVIAEKLVPTRAPHAFGTKRPRLETAYYEAFNLPHVRLVDVRDEKIVKITPEGVTTEKRAYPLDVIIFATGYNCLTGSMLAIDIRGRNGRLLADKWPRSTEADSVDTYLGVTTAGFPNMFFLAGPHAPIPRATTPQIVEMQGEWMAKVVAEALRKKKAVIEATEQGEKWWRTELDRAAKASLLSHTGSWYMGANIPGMKKEALIYCGEPAEYADFLKQSVNAGFPGIHFT